MDLSSNEPRVLADLNPMIVVSEMVIVYVSQVGLSASIDVDILVQRLPSRISTTCSPTIWHVEDVDCKQRGTVRSASIDKVPAGSS